MDGYNHGGGHMHGHQGAQAHAGYSSYNDDYPPDTSRGHSSSPREYLHTPVYSASSDQGFGAHNGRGYAHAVGPGSAASTARDGESVKGSFLLDDDKERSVAKSRRERRRCCGNGRYCWCCSKRCCCIFIPVLLVVLAGLGVTLYYVFPRMPAVTFDRVDVVQQGQGKTLAQRGLVGRRDGPGGVLGVVGSLLDNVSIDRHGAVTVPLVIHMNVTNPNFIAWTIHNVTVSGYVANSTAGGTNFPVGSGGLRDPFYMPKKSTANDMPIYFNFRLGINDTNYLPAAITVQKACTPGGPKLRFYYHANVVLRAISWLGIRPGFSDTISFACPISEIEGLGIKIGDLTGLTPSEISGIL